MFKRTGYLGIVKLKLEASPYNTKVGTYGVKEGSLSLCVRVSPYMYAIIIVTKWSLLRFNCMSDEYSSALSELPLTNQMDIIAYY